MRAFPPLQQWLVIGLCLGCAGVGSLRAADASLHSVKPPSAPRLPMSTVFQGEQRFNYLVKRAERENWRALPLGQRTVRVALAMLGVPYANYTLEVDDYIESPVVNLNAMDCWTFYENSLGFARMLRYKPAPYQPRDLLHMIELERYRDGRCTGSYLSRMHQLEEVFYDNQRRGYAVNITPQLPGARRIQRDVREMQLAWRHYRYLHANPGLLDGMARIERRVSSLPVCHVPASRARAVERYLQDGDICAITSNESSSYTSHVGLIVRRGDRAWFMHATSDRDKGRKMVLDKSITDYLNERSSHAGIIVCRPRDLPPSPMWERNVAGGGPGGSRG